MPNASKYHDLLEYLGFIKDERPGEVRDAILNLRKLPDAPIYSVVVDEDDEELSMTFVVDEIGALWVCKEPISLSDYGFESYFKFRTTVEKSLDS